MEKVVQPSENSIPILSIEQAMEKVGNKNHYQRRLVFLLCIQRIFLGFTVFCFPFLFKKPNFQCRDTPESPWELCTPTPENCLRHIQPVPDAPRTLITEFNLYCDNAYIEPLIQTWYMLATSIGTFLIGSIADSMGRKPVLLLSSMLFASPFVLAAFIPNIWFIFVMLLISGIGGGPYSIYTFMYLSEVADNTVRVSGVMMANICRGVAQGLVGFLVAFVHEDWRWMMLFYMGLPFTLSCILSVKWIDESPKFLVMQRKFEEAKYILSNKIAKANKKPSITFIFPQEVETTIQKDTQATTQSKPKTLYTYLDLFKFKSLRIPLFTCTVIIIANNFTFFGAVWTLQYIQAPLSYVTFATALGETLAYLSGTFIYAALSRRAVFVIFQGLSILACLSFVLVNVPKECTIDSALCWQNYFQIVVMTIYRYSQSHIIAMLFIYLNEVFPTPVRSLGNAFTGIISRVVASFSAVAVKASSGFGLHPIVMFGVVLIPAFVASFMLRETKGKPLPDEIEEQKTKKVE